MTRSHLIIAAVLLAAWFGLKDVVFRSVFPGKTPSEQIAATYNGDDGWAVIPVEPPPGAWLDPWGIDLYIIPPPSGAAAGKGLIGAFHAKAAEEMTKHAHKIEKALAPSGPSYSPIYRHPSASMRPKANAWDVAHEDIAIAFERYLYTKNNMRGILLVSSPQTQDFVAPILARIESDPRLLERFSGVLWLQTNTTPPNMEVNCSPVMIGNCDIVGIVQNTSSWLGWMLPRQPRKSVRFEFSDPEQLATQLTERNTKLSIWLDENAPKPAEPLGGFDDIEIVDVAPIRRPGETDEILAEDGTAGQPD